MWSLNALSTRTAIVLDFPQRSRLIKHELRVARAHMLSSQFSIDPDCGRMEYGLKFDPRRGILPCPRSMEGSLIPGNIAIISEVGSTCQVRGTFTLRQSMTESSVPYQRCSAPTLPEILRNHHAPQRLTVSGADKSGVFSTALRTSAPRVPLRLIAELNPLPRGWGEYYKRAHVQKLFQRLDGWIRRRIWSHRCRRWRDAGWTRLPLTKLYCEYELVRLIDLIPSLASRRR
jgi:hypothetical protein